MVMGEQVVWSPAHARPSLNRATNRRGALGWVPALSELQGLRL